MPGPLAPLLVGGLLDIGGKLIDKLFPDPEKAAQARLELALLQQQGELREIEVRMSAILMEAQSSDPWTSRARPSFLYVMYTLILTSIPMGIWYAVDPASAGEIAAGFRSWLEAIPDKLWDLMLFGYLGYAGARSWEKNQRVKM